MSGKGKDINELVQYAHNTYLAFDRGSGGNGSHGLWEGELRAVRLSYEDRDG